MSNIENKIKSINTKNKRFKEMKLKTLPTNCNHQSDAIGEQRQ